MLAFTLEEAPGAPADEVGRTTIGAGTKVQSTPGPDESPQVYETFEEITGRVAWNAIEPPQNKRHPLTGSENPLYFEGLATGLKPGDAVLYRTDEGDSAFGIVNAVEPQPEQEHTEVTVSYLTQAPNRSAPNLDESEPELEPGKCTCGPDGACNLCYKPEEEPEDAPEEKAPGEFFVAEPDSDAPEPDLVAKEVIGDAVANTAALEEEPAEDQPEPTEPEEEDEPAEEPESEEPAEEEQEVSPDLSEPYNEEAEGEDPT